MRASRAFLTSLKSWMFAARPTAQTTNVITAKHIMLDTVNASSGSDITLDTTTAYTDTLGVASIGRFTLKANKTYKLTGSAGSHSGGNSELVVRWRNADSGAYLGYGGGNSSPTFGADRTGHGLAMAVFTPTVDTLVELNIENNSSNFVTKVGGDATGGGAMSYAFIEVLK